MTTARLQHNSRQMWVPVDATHIKELPHARLPSLSNGTVVIIFSPPFYDRFFPAEHLCTFRDSYYTTTNNSSFVPIRDPGMESPGNSRQMSDAEDRYAPVYWEPIGGKETSPAGDDCCFVASARAILRTSSLVSYCAIQFRTLLNPASELSDST